MSHFTTLVNFELSAGLSTLAPDLSAENLIKKAELEARLAKNPQNSIAEFCLENLLLRHPSEMQLEADNKIGDMMEPFCECTENPAYLEPAEDEEDCFINPNATWDWYAIGGRWPFQFLVNAEEPFVIRTSDKTGGAPDGYVWVAGAKKSAIQWDLMKSLAIAQNTKSFYALEKWYETGVKPDDVNSLSRLVDDGIAGWQTMLYIKDETLDAYLQRTGLSADRKYFVDGYSFLQDGTWFSQGNMGWFGVSCNDKEKSEWAGMLEAYIDQIFDDDMIVSIDCHI